MWQPVQSFEAANYETKLHSADQTDVVLGLAVCHNTNLILLGLLFYFPPQKASLFYFYLRLFSSTAIRRPLAANGNFAEIMNLNCG